MVDIRWLHDNDCGAMLVMMHPPILLFLAALIAAGQFSASVLSVSSDTQPFPTTNNQADWLTTDDKSRLGSIPPSCYNKCNVCRPCMAVQAPTLPTHDQRRTAENKFLPQWDGDPYANYKPLGWKCRCGSRLFNP